MLRNVILYTASVLAAIGILIISLFAVTYHRVRALSVVTPSPALLATPAPSLVPYALPYPGLLPDSPLWVFKAARDKFLLLISFSNISKFQKLSLYADKRISATKVLIENGNVDTGVNTSVKAEKYLLEATQLFKKDQNLSGEKNKLVLEISKHQEIIEALQQQSPQVSASLKEALSINRLAFELLK